MARDTTKFRKVSDLLYEEDWDEGRRPLQWERQFEVIEIRLTRATVVDIVSAEFSNVGIADRTETSRGPLLKGSGKISNGSVTLFNPRDGEPERFDTVHFSISQTARWDEAVEDFKHGTRDFNRIQFFGSFYHFSEADIDHWSDDNKPHLALQLYARPEELTELLAPLMNANGNPIISVAAHVPLFRSEVDRALSEPWHGRDFFIESRCRLPAYLSSMRAERQILVSNSDDSEADDELVDEPEPSAPHTPAETLMLLAEMRLIRQMLTLVAILLGVLAFMLAFRW